MTMNAKELADRVVALGAEECGNDYRWLDAGVIDAVPAEEFINDGRVVMALMNRCRDELPTYDWLMFINTLVDKEKFKEADIVEACCEALENGQ